MPRSKVQFSSTGDHINDRLRNDRLRPREAAEIAHASVGMVHQWIKEKRFHSRSVTQPGKKRGLRYIDGPSFRAFLESQMEEVLK